LERQFGSSWIRFASDVSMYEFRDVADVLAEMFYNLRYVEETGRNTHPWSIRRMGVYQKFSAQTNSSVWILIQPTLAAKRLARISTESTYIFHPSMHVTLISSTLRKWRGYLRDLDRNIRDKVRSNLGSMAQYESIADPFSQRIESKRKVFQRRGL